MPKNPYSFPTPTGVKKITTQDINGCLIEQVEETKNAYLLITLGYRHYVLPVEKGIQLMTLMRIMEEVSECSDWERKQENSKTKTAPIPTTEMNFSYVSWSEYLSWKTKEILIPE